MIVNVQLRLDRCEHTGYRGDADNTPSAGRTVHHCDDRHVDGDVRDIPGDAVEDAAKLRRLSRHSGQLTIGGVHDAVKDEKGDAEPGEPRPRNQSTTNGANPRPRVPETAFGERRARRAPIAIR